MIESPVEVTQEIREEQNSPQEKKIGPLFLTLFISSLLIFGASIQLEYQQSLLTSAEQYSGSKGIYFALAAINTFGLLLLPNTQNSWKRSGYLFLFYLNCLSILLLLLPFYDFFAGS